MLMTYYLALKDAGIISLLDFTDKTLTPKVTG